MPETEDKTAEFLAEETQALQPPTVEQTIEGQSPVVAEKEPEKPIEELKKPEVEESVFVIPKDEMDEIMKDWGAEIPQEDVYPPSPLAAPPSQVSPQQIPSDIPAEIFQITPQQFMPQGQEFDPAEMYVPGTQSQMALSRATAEQTRRISIYERERYEREQVARQQMKAIQDFINQKKREGVPDAAIQGFVREITDGSKPISLDMLWNAKVLEKHQARRKAQGSRKPARNEESPAPVTAATRVTERVLEPDEIVKEADSLIGVS